MIVRSIQASNFGRFESLSIENLPERGLVGVVGPNESGKSTIGEVLSFALFGRSGHERAPEEHINWHADECEVRLDFLDDEGRRWRVIRRLDRSGTYMAFLSSCSEDWEPGETLEGVGRVERRLAELLGLDFGAFRYSFFLGQKELDLVRSDSPSHRRDVVRRLTGMDVVERARDAAAAEAASAEDECARLREELVVCSRLVEEYEQRGAFEDPQTAGRIEELEREVERGRRTLEALRKHLSEMRRMREAREKLSLYVCWSKAVACHLAMRWHMRRLERLREVLRERLAELEQRMEAERKELADRESFRRALENLCESVELLLSRLEKELEPTLPATLEEEELDTAAPVTRYDFLLIARAKVKQAEAAAREAARKAWHIFLLLLLAVAPTGYLAHVSGVSDWFRGADPNRLALVVLSGSICLAIAVVAAYQFFLARRWRRKAETLKGYEERLDKEIAAMRRRAAACRELLDGGEEHYGELIAKIGDEELARQWEELSSSYPSLAGARHSAEVEYRLERDSKESARLRQLLEEAEAAFSSMEEKLKLLSSSPFFEPRDHDAFERAIETRCSKEGDPAPSEASSAVAEAKRAFARLFETAQRALFLLDEKCGTVVSEKICRNEEEARSLLELLQPDAAASIPLDSLECIRRGAWEGDSDKALEEVTRIEQRLASLSGAPKPAQVLLDAGMEDTEDEDTLFALLDEWRERLSTAKAELASLKEQSSRREPDAARLAELRSSKSALEHSLSEAERRWRVHILAVDLMDGLLERMAARLGPALAEYMGMIIPLVTGDRYREVRIDDEMNLEVFSPEKGDYVPLELLSGGTVDQLLLAMRLAFARAVTDTRLGGAAHFLFFDEPLSSFDEYRGKAFLRMLSRFTDVFAQIFVVSHLPALSEAFDVLVETRLEHTTLEIDLGTSRRATPSPDAADASEGS